MKYKNLFTPVTIGSVTIKNRFAMAPMGPLGLADAQGGFNQRGIDYYTERDKGGNRADYHRGYVFRLQGGDPEHAQLPEFHL